MTTNDADLERYVAARWAALVGTLTRLGCDQATAADVVTGALARSYRRWDQVRRGDADVRVFGDVVHESRHVVPASVAQARDALAAAGLRAEQVDQVLDRRDWPTDHDAPPGPPADTFVLPPRVEVVAARARTQRRRRARAGVRTLVGVGLVLATAVALGGVADRSATDGPRVGWYADGVLHGRGTAVDLPGVTDLLHLDQGSAYVAAGGVLGYVERDGRRHRLDTEVARVRPVSSTDGTRLAWVTTRRGRPRLVVLDVAHHRVDDALDLARQLPAAARDLRRLHLVALDGAVLSFAVGDRDLRWVVGGGDPPYAAGHGLLAEAGSVVARQRARGVVVERPRLGGTVRVPGVGALLSPEGGYVLTRVPTRGATAAGRPFRPMLHDAVTGRRLPSGVGRDELVLDAAFGDDLTLTYLVVPVRDPAAGPDPQVVSRVVVRTCALATTTCAERPPAERRGGPVLLAR